MPLLNEKLQQIASCCLRFALCRDDLLEVQGREGRVIVGVANAPHLPVLLQVTQWLVPRASACEAKRNVFVDAVLAPRH